MEVSRFMKHIKQNASSEIKSTISGDCVVNPFHKGPGMDRASPAAGSRSVEVGKGSAPPSSSPRARSLSAGKASPGSGKEKRTGGPKPASGW